MDKKEKTAEYLSQLAHDMKSPLTVLKQYLTSLPISEDEDLKEFHEAASRSLENLIRLAENMNATKEQAYFKPDLIDIVEILSSVVTKLKPRAETTGINIKYIGPEMFYGHFDASLIERLMTNLVTNALEAFPINGGTIQVFLRHNGDNVLVEVRDNASGIPNTIIEKIFEKNFTYGKPCGTGLGLDICKDIVCLHNGKIGVHSIFGQGTVFTLSFPRSNSFYNPCSDAVYIEREDSIH